MHAEVWKAFLQAQFLSLAICSLSFLDHFSSHIGGFLVSGLIHQKSPHGFQSHVSEMQIWPHYVCLKVLGIFTIKLRLSLVWRDALAPSFSSRLIISHQLLLYTPKTGFAEILAVPNMNHFLSCSSFVPLPTMFSFSLCHHLSFLPQLQYLVLLPATLVPLNNIFKPLFLIPSVIDDSVARADFSAVVWGTQHGTGILTGVSL